MSISEKVTSKYWALGPLFALQEEPEMQKNYYCFSQQHRRRATIFNLYYNSYTTADRSVAETAEQKLLSQFRWGLSKKSFVSVELTVTPNDLPGGRSEVDPLLADVGEMFVSSMSTSAILPFLSADGKRIVWNNDYINRRDTTPQASDPDRAKRAAKKETISSGGRANGPTFEAPW